MKKNETIWDRMELRETKSLVVLSPQERAIGFAMLSGDYKSLLKNRNEGASGGEKYSTKKISNKDFPAIAEKFRTNTKDCIATMRNALFAVRHNTGDNLSEAERERRLMRYLEAAFSLQVKLDKDIFPPDSEIHKGIPPYVMDGLTDMGTDEQTDPRMRYREKIRVDKMEIFRQNKELFARIFRENITPEQFQSDSKYKMHLAEMIAQEVHDHMPYNYANLRIPNAQNRTIALHELRATNYAVCRHHALEAQTLMQFMGLSSRLVKCTLNGGPHAANLLRTNNKWGVLDVTNPDLDGSKKQKQVFYREIPEQDIDLNSQQYTWNLKKNDGSPRIYITRPGDMYYQIKDNTKEPIK